MAIENLVAYFEKLLPLDKNEEEVIRRSFFERKIRRRQFILQEGAICKENTFIVSGCFRVYLVDKQGKEHNLQFAIENEWLLDIHSFHNELPSELYIEAMENSVILQIKKEQQIHLFEYYLKFNRIFRVLCENQLIQTQQRLLKNISSTAEEKYNHFIEENPHLINRISNVQIASYLGITPEFLSMTRKKMSKS